MKAILSICFLISQIGLAVGQQNSNALPRELLIKIAEMAAPEDKRSGAKIYGYTDEGEFTVLREGSNDFVCLAPNTKQSMLYSYAYPVQLDPFMARGRELVKAGKKVKEKNEIREAEIKAGTLSMPKGPSPLFCYWGKKENLDPQTGEIKDALRRYVIYIPYATAAETGLPDKPGVPGMPWLMDAGSYKAHIMINPENLFHAHSMQ